MLPCLATYSTNRTNEQNVSGRAQSENTRCPLVKLLPELAEPAWKQGNVSHEGHLRNLDLLQKTRTTRIPSSNQTFLSPPDIPEIRITKKRYRLLDSDFFIKTQNLNNLNSKSEILTVANSYLYSKSEVLTGRNSNLNS